MIIVRNLQKQFEESTVLDHVSFQADPGEFIAVLGGSGSGKSSLLRSLALKDKWTEGQYIFNGRDITQASLWEKFVIGKNIAYLEEKPYSNKNTTALKYVLSGSRARFPLWRKLTFSVPEDEYMYAMDILENVGLIDKAKSKIGTLSGGEQQRVAIAYALAKGAQVFLADEPVTGLDPHSAGRVLEDIKEICRKKQVIFICTLHQVELAEKYASRIWGLHEGRLVFDISGRRLTTKERELVF